MVVTIDGPGGAGKTTISRALAAHLNFAFLDTGALYRAIGLSALGEGQNLANMDDAMLQAWLSRVGLELLPEGAALNGHLVEPFIRNEEVAAMASKVSALKPVREFLLDLQRRAGQTGHLVAEGRDMGTVVFPDAQVKFFLTATEEERARRRFKDLAPHNPQLTLEQVQKEVAERDERDSTRALAPLKPAQDAVMVDSTHMSEKQVLAFMAGKVKEILA